MLLKPFDRKTCPSSYTNNNKLFLNKFWNIKQLNSPCIVPAFIKPLACFTFFCLPLILGAQKVVQTTGIPPQLLSILKENLAQGDLIALRDVAKLVDKTPRKESVIKLAKQFTLLTPTEWNWEKDLEDKSFTEFFYQHSADFRFSELLSVFYLTPIEERPSTVKISSKKEKQIDPFLIRESVQKIGTYLRKKDLQPLLKEIEHIGVLENPTVHTILGDLMDKNELLSLKSAQKQIVFSAIMTYLPDSLVFEKLLKLTKQKVFPLNYCQHQLARFTNNYIVAKDHSTLFKAYQELQTSFDNDLMLIKEYGYQKSTKIKALFFEEKVDYYGWLAATVSDSLFWIQRNAVVDMLGTHQPKALFYIAGLNLRHWKANGENHQAYNQLIEQNIDVMLTVNPQDGLPIEESIINYWSKHYEDYAWDNFENKFTNQQLFSSELEAYDKYFRRLNSTNDTIADKAFLALCEGKPNEIQGLIKKFKPLLRNYNGTLPPLKYKILEQVSLFSHFCREYEIEYQPSKALTQQLEKLSGPLLPKERMVLENQLIKTLTIEELTPLEYYTSIHAQNLNLNYSVGRVLDYLYSKHWATILSDEYQFRLYLFKTQLFQGFGGFGISKKYANKIDLNDPIAINLLQNLKKLETNPYILQSIVGFLDQKSENTKEKKITKFLAEPTAIDREGLKELPPFGAEEIQEIVQGLFLQEDKKAINNIGAYLELYASIDMIPQLFETNQKQWLANKYAGIALVKVLEKVYQFSFAAKQQESITRWWKLWNTIPENYADWSTYLFQRQLEKVRKDKELKINDINSVVKSSFYKEKYRILCLESLQKVKKSRTIYRLQIKPKISVKTELKYLENIDFSTRELGNLPKMFEVNDPQKLLAFIIKKSKSADNESKSTLYNTLFRQAWFINHITSGQILPENCNDIKLIFYQYLSQSTFLTEYEEQNTQLNIVHLENAYLSLKDKLNRIAKDSLNDAIRYDYLNATLSRMEFPEIMVAFPILKDLEIANKNLFLFMNRDFGLPIFDVPTEKVAQDLLNQLKNNNEFEFYEQTLTDFGLPITKKSGALNYNKIYEILTYDLVVPFLGDGGKYRDYYTYGLVKLLELHFKTTLGFHPKLNENQTFYTFNSYNRVLAWRDYLEEQGLVKVVGNQFFR